MSHEAKQRNDKFKEDAKAKGSCLRVDCRGLWNCISIAISFTWLLQQFHLHEQEVTAMTIIFTRDSYDLNRKVVKILYKEKITIISTRPFTWIITKKMHALNTIAFAISIYSLSSNYLLLWDFHQKCPTNSLEKIKPSWQT